MVFLRWLWITFFRSKLIIYILLCIIALFCLTTFPQQIDRWIGSEIREALNHAFVLILVFYIFFHFTTTAAFINDVKMTFVNVLSADRSLFDNLGKEVKGRYVANSIQSAVGDTFGQAIVSDIIDPYLKQHVPNRNNFIYRIEALDTPPTFGVLETEGCKKLVERLTAENGYLWLRQRCGYSPIRADSGRPDRREFIIAFTFDKIQLQHLLPKHEIFFREIIEMEKELKQVALQFTEVEAREFIEKVLGLSVVESSGNPRSPLEYSVSVEKDRATLELYIKIKTRLPKGSKSAGIELEFNFPQSREAPWFVSSLPQPCFKPTISFRRNEQMTRLEPVLFLSSFEEKKVITKKFPDNSDDPKFYEVTVDGWTFPTNGIMFTWRYKNSGSKRP